MDALDYAKRLIAFDSSSRRSNLPIIDYLEGELKRLGFEVERLEYDDAEGVRKACLAGKKGAGRGGMAYFGHVDTVPAERWTAGGGGPFAAQVRGGRLYGRGACDMKGSLACILAAAAAFDAGRLAQPLYITFTADEEVGYWGAKVVAERSALFQEMAAGDARGVIGEPTSLDVVHAHKGSYGFRAVAHGVAAHSSSSRGVNANLAMIPFLVEMKAIHDECEADPAWRDERFDPPTISWNIGINDFTTAINVTPPQSVCTVYFRPMPGQDPEKLLRRARDAARRCGLDFDMLIRGEPLYVDPDSPYVREVLELAGKRQPRTVAYGTDGVMLTRLPRLVVVGPGDIAQAHTEDEWISLDQLERGVQLYRTLIQRWCAAADPTA